MKLQEVQEKAVPILKRKSVKRAGVFGSLARGEASPRDIDMLVEVQRPFGLFASITSDLPHIQNLYFTSPYFDAKAACTTPSDKADETYWNLCAFADKPGETIRIS